MQQPHEFGQELRRRRLAAALSLQQLGKLVHYSKSQLSKVERGLKAPTRELAIICDARLSADGALTRLVPPPMAAAPLPQLPEPRHDGEVWLMHLDKDGTGSFRSVGRRTVITAGAASVLALGTADTNSVTEDGAANVVDASLSLFTQFRRLGQSSGPGLVLPPLIAQAHSLEQLATRCGARTRAKLLVLASRYAEYAGWMAQEAGNDEAALWWTDRAVKLAATGNDRALATYALARRSLISLFRGDPTRAAGLAERALAGTAPPRIRGLAAQTLAQSQAVLGDHRACMHSLDRARDLLGQEPPEPSAPVIGASHLPDVVSMFTGWCLYELGRPAQAAEVLDRETARLPAHALRTRSRYGVRRALAHASAGELDHACSLTEDLLGSVTLVHSATITADLRRLSRILLRHPRNASVRALDPRLSTTLSSLPA